MIFRRARVELPDAERRLYESLRQDVDVDPVHEDRTVAALRAAGLFEAPLRTLLRPARAARRRMTTIAAVAAIVVAIVGTSTLLETRRSNSRAPSFDSARSATIDSAQLHRTDPPVLRADNATATASPSYLVWY
jgi:hypothetical protein